MPAASPLRPSVFSLIEQRFPNAVPVARRIAPPVATGIPELDQALPNGGFPLGKLSIAESGGGISAMLRAACDHTVAAGDRAAWIDGARTVAGAFWREGPLLVRPDGHTRAVRAAGELLRSGGFRLVVLTGVRATDTETMRLVRAAHEGGGAFISITSNATMAALRLSSRVTEWCWRFDPFGEPAMLDSVRVRSHARALGWNRSAEFLLGVEPHDLRLSLEPGLADRRGLLRGQRLRVP